MSDVVTARTGDEPPFNRDPTIKPQDGPRRGATREEPRNDYVLDDLGHVI
jgi:hypothetical protein